MTGGLGKEFIDSIEVDGYPTVSEYQKISGSEVEGRILRPSEYGKDEDILNAATLWKEKRDGTKSNPYGAGPRILRTCEQWATPTHKYSEHLSGIQCEYRDVDPLPGAVGRYGASYSGTLDREYRQRLL